MSATRIPVGLKDTALFFSLMVAMFIGAVGAGVGGAYLFRAFP